MPTLVLLEILAVAMLVFRNCILGMFGSRADRIRRHPLYMFGINLPLKTFYSLVTVSRRAPGWGLGVFLCLGVLCVFTILIGVVWWKSLIYPAELLSMKALLFFLIIPGVILALQILFLSWSTRLFGMMGEGRRQEGGSA